MNGKSAHSKPDCLPILTEYNSVIVYTKEMENRRRREMEELVGT